MKDVPKHTRLHRREGSRNYYFRAKVPADLLPFYGGKREIYYSLKTSNPREALERVRLESVKLDQEFAEKRRQRDTQPVQTLSKAEMERLVLLIEHSVLNANDEMRTAGDFAGLEFDRRLAEAEHRVQRAQKAFARGDLDHVEDVVLDWLQGHNIELPTTSEEFKALSFAVLKAETRLAGQLKARMDGNPIETPIKPVPLGVSSTPPSDGNSPTITQIHGMWAAEHLAANGPQKTVNDFGIYVKRFVEIHGDLPVNQIVKAHVRDYKDAMLRYPARPTGKMKKMNTPQLLEYVQKHPDTQVLSPRTVNDRALGAIGAVLGWAEENAYIEMNPASKVKVKAAKVTKTVRLPYSVDDLNAIFRFPVYTEGDRPNAGAGEAAKWLPLLATFTGARLEELGQLTTDDIKEEREVIYLDMSTLDEGKRRKTESSKRRVPLHSKLIEVGFLDYVEEVRKGKGTRLFPLLVAQNEKLTAAWSKWWGRYARKYGGFDNLKVFHSFRHAFKDALREGGVQEEVSDALTGHAPQTEGRKYGGQAYPINRLKDGIEMLTYPGLNLESLKA